MMLNKILKPVFAASTIIGDEIKNPLTPYGEFNTAGKGLVLLLTNLLRLVFVVAGIWAFLNFVLAGFAYMTAAGDPKKLTAAWGRIWQTLMGLIIIVSSFALASLFGYLIFGDAGFILNPQIYGPK